MKRGGCSCLPFVQISNPGRTVIDGVKIAFFSKTIVNDLLGLGVEVMTPVEIETGGVVHFPKFAKYRNLNFKISESTRVEISGSLHKYWKNGENISAFNFGELCECIADLCQKFYINPLQARLHILEFGVNVRTPFDSFEFCRRLIAFKQVAFSKFGTTGRTKFDIGFEAVWQQYSVKAYAKSKQYHKTDSILRYEVRVTKMKYLEQAGVCFLADLMKAESLVNLGKILNETFSEVIFQEQVNTAELTANDKRIYALCSNPKEWELLTPKNRHIKKKQFKAIINAKGQTQWKETTAKLISDNWGTLLTLRSEKSRDILTELKNLKSGNNLTDLKKNGVGRFNRLDNGLIHPHPFQPEKRVCKSCGRDISNQKKGSRFCSAKYVGEAAAKRCRNLDSDTRRTDRIRYKGKQLLFDVGMYLLLMQAEGC